MVDKEQARMLVAAIGYEEASKQTGIKAATLRKWSERYKWKVIPTHKLAVTNVTKPADALAATLRDHKKRTQLGFSRAAMKVAEEQAQLPVETLRMPKESLVAKSWADVAAKSQGWEERDPGASPLNLNVLSQNTVIAIGNQPAPD